MNAPSKALWLDHGRMRMMGAARAVTEEYEAFMKGTVRMAA